MMKNNYNMDWKCFLIALSTCLCFSCQQGPSDSSLFDSVEDVPQHKVYFSAVNPHSTVKGNGSFVVVKDTVFFADYYFDYNDGKELTVFSFQF